VWVDEREWDLAATDADLAIRPTRRPPAGWVGVDLGAIEMGVYAHESLAKAFRSDGLNKIPWVVRHPESGPRADRAWTEATVPDASVGSRWNRACTLIEAVRSGLGAGLLPCFVGDALGLRRLQNVRLGHEPAKLWLLAHPDLKRDARVRAVIAAARALGKIGG
jgi:DNA-binding transcriptional LysR family regulator